MTKSIVVKGPSGVVAIADSGDVLQISDPAIETEIEKLVSERQRVGREISHVLKRHGLHALSDDEPTEVIEPPPG